MAAQLEQAGYEVLFDDREQSPGAKFKDADLIGVPVQVIIGKTWAAQGLVEVASRKDKTKQQIPPNQLVPAVAKLLDKPAVAS